MEIKVLGPGCPNCVKLDKLARAVAVESGVPATVLKVTAFQEIAALGVLSTPALVVNGEVKCVGRVPSAAEIRAWITA